MSIIDSNKSHKVILHYIHDPMCSWCWAFRPVWKALKNSLPSTIEVHNSLGGLAADTNEPMSLELQNKLQSIWHHIQKAVPSTEFNFDFWHLNQPRRSTYPACRAVIAARKQGLEYEEKMILAIQQAYYLKAQNPSDDNTLISLSNGIGLNASDFERQLKQPETEQQLSQEIAFNQSIQATSFPSLVLEFDGIFHAIPIDYLDEKTMLKSIKANATQGV
jgi:putative protein-disulfide isomerase